MLLLVLSPNAQRMWVNPLDVVFIDDTTPLRVSIRDIGVYYVDPKYCSDAHAMAFWVCQAKASSTATEIKALGGPSA